MKIEILLACYNGSKYIREQIQSILDQSYQDFRLLIADDCSTDNTLLIIEEFKNKYSDKMTVYPLPANLGIVKCFSFLMEHAEADYLMFSDQDDIWFSEKIEKSYLKMKELERKFDKNVPLLVFTDAEVIDENGLFVASSDWASKRFNPKRANHLNRILLQNSVIGCTMMFNKSLCLLATPIPPESYVHDYWISLIAAGMGKIDYVKEATMRYRQHPDQYVGSNEYSFSWFFDTFKNREVFQKKIEFRILQCQVRAFAFYRMYQNSLSDSDSKMMQAFIGLKHQSIGRELIERFWYCFIPQGLWYGIAYLIGTIRMGRADPKTQIATF